MPRESACKTPRVLMDDFLTEIDAPLFAIAVQVQHVGERLVHPDRAFWDRGRGERERVDHAGLRGAVDPLHGQHGPGLVVVVWRRPLFIRPTECGAQTNAPTHARSTWGGLTS